MATYIVTGGTDSSVERCYHSFSSVMQLPRYMCWSEPVPWPNLRRRCLMSSAMIGYIR